LDEYEDDCESPSTNQPVSEPKSEKVEEVARSVNSETKKMRELALKNKRPGGVEARQMSDNNTGLDLGATTDD